MDKEVNCNAKVKAAVAEIDEMFFNATNFVSCQKGKEMTLSECLEVLNKHKKQLPLHVFRVLQCVLVKVAGKELPEGESICLEDTMVHAGVFREVEEYRHYAEALVCATYPDYFPENMVFEEVYAFVYDRYLADVLRVW